MRRFFSLLVCSLVLLSACQCQEEEYDVPETAPIVVSSKISTSEITKKTDTITVVRSTTHVSKEQAHVVKTNVQANHHNHSSE